MSSSIESQITPRAQARGVNVRRTAVVTIVVALSVWFIDNLDRTLIAFAMPAIGEEFGVGNAELGWIAGGYTLVLALMKIPAGILVDRFGPKRLLIIELCAWTVFMVLIGLSQTFLMLLVLRMIFGIFAGMLAVSVIKLVAERLVPRWRTFGVGVISTGNLLMLALVPLIVAPLLAAFAWRSVFMAVAVLGIVVALVIRFFLPAALPDDLRSEGMHTVAGLRIPTVAILKVPAIWRLAVLSALLNMISFGLFSWGPTYLIQERGVEGAAAGWMIALPFGAMALSVAGGSLLYDRVFHRRPRLLATPALIIASALMIPMALSQSAGEFVIWQSLAMALAGLAEVTITGTVMRGVPTEAVGTVMGVISTGMFAGGFIAPLMIGYVSEYVSFSAAFGVLVFTTAAAAALFLFVRPDFLGKTLERLAHDKRPSSAVDGPAV